MLGKSRITGITYRQRERYLSFILQLRLSNRYDPGLGLVLLPLRSIH